MSKLLAILVAVGLGISSAVILPAETEGASNAAMTIQWKRSAAAIDTLQRIGEEFWEKAMVLKTPAERACALGQLLTMPARINERMQQEEKIWVIQVDYRQLRESMVDATLKAVRDGQPLKCENHLSEERLAQIAYGLIVAERHRVDPLILGYTEETVARLQQLAKQ